MEEKKPENLNQFDIMSGALFRELYRVKKQAPKNEKKSWSDYCAIITPKNNGRGGLWFYLGKDYITGSGLNLVGGLGDENNIINPEKFIESIDSEFGKQIFQEVIDGIRGCIFFKNCLSYSIESVFHSDQRGLFREQIEQMTELKKQNIREIKE